MRCNDQQLKQLLSADESSREYQLVAGHVDQCPRCQRRLAELSDEFDLLPEIRQTLLDLQDTVPYQPTSGSSVFVEINSSAAAESSAECEPVVLDFLTAASHPEMLGRIGRYEIERMIGSGGMGIVLKGFDTELHRVVAVKVLKPHLAHNGAARSRFAREAQSAAAVVHEHVIPIHDVQSDVQTPYLVMQYVPGQSLQARVDERGALESKEVLRIARQIAAGLAAAHAQGLVHRDVKPANILLGDTVERVLISDFGLARTVDDATLTRTGIVAGTPHYMSPEQASGQPVDARSDLFSLGSVIYFMCTGRPPFRAEHAMATLNRICHDVHRPVDEINRDVPAELADAVDRLLEKDPRQRFANALDVERRLEAILATLQKGRWSYRLRYRRSWRRWWPIMKTSVIRLALTAACVASGIGLARWFSPADSHSVVATNQGSLVERRGDLPPTFAETTNPNHLFEQTEPGLAIGEAPTPLADQIAVPLEVPEVANPDSDFTAEVEMPQDGFLTEVEEVGILVNSVEELWKQLSSRVNDSTSSTDNWYLELQQTELEVESIQQSQQTKNKTQP